MAACRSASAAHEIASRLETAVQDELGPDVEVETHIEPLQTEDLTGRDAPAERINAISSTLSRIATGLGSVREVHDVRMRETADGEIVNFHCRVDPALSVHDVHEKVDELERGLRQSFPTIKRVIGHAEPGL
jgi:divalent metal cation (Fe/Co/Zn/Cd) transporter